MAIYVRSLTKEEKDELEKIVRCRKEASDKVKRAQILLLSDQKVKATQISRLIGNHPNIVRARIHRFNEEGIESALCDRPRTGRPLTYDENQRGIIISTARTSPKALGVAMCHWTLEQLQYYINENKGIAIGYRQIQRILKAEKIKWQKSRDWLESDDPEFVPKRGLLSQLTPIQTPSIGLSALTS